jgi:hypothetical protein
MTVERYRNCAALPADGVGQFFALHGSMGSMRKFGLTTAISAFLTLVVAAPSAFAQTPLLRDNGAPPDNPWHHGSTVDLFGGSASTSEDTRGTAGGGFGWEINHWVEVDASGTWLVARQGDSAFAANLKAVVSLTRPREVVPFLGAGVGVYHAVFDTTRGSVPAFYQSRLPAGTLDSLATFNDPALVFDAGANIFASRHVSIRPDLGVIVVTKNSSAYTVATAVVHLIYHFENHAIPD